MPQDVRYRIVGSGPVALACALFLVRAGIDPSRLHLQLPSALDSADQPPAPVGGSARRMLALSDGSRQLLSRIIAMPPGGTIERIEITMSGRSGRTRIAASDFNIDALGHVIPYPDLVDALRAAAAAFALPPHTGSPSTRWLTIHAAGMPRPSQRSARGFHARDFGQSALLTEVMAQTGGRTAYECFGRNGPLALLPADSGHRPRYAVVWCDQPPVTAARAAMAPDQLSRALTEAFAESGPLRSALGRLQICAAVEVVALSRVRRANSASGDEVWIGNAAQSLHPVAGQGLNLGLRDAFELARMLADNEFAQQPVDPARLLARFAAGRRFDRAVTTGVTDLLAAGFTWPLARPIQSALLATLDLLPPVRRPLASALLFGSR